MSNPLGRDLPVMVLLLVSFVVLSLMTVALCRSSSLMLDDGYYYMQIVWHISQGDGTTFDGINLTNVGTRISSQRFAGY